MLVNLFTVFATGAPGLTRLLFAMVINVWVGLESALPVLIDVSLVIALNMLFSQGFAILLLRKMDITHDSSVSMASYLSVIVGCLFLYTLHLLGYISFIIPCWLMLFGLVGYQNIRHRLLRNQSFFRVSLLEVAVWCSFILLAVYSHLNREISPAAIFYGFAIPLSLFSLYDLFTLDYGFASRLQFIQALHQAALIGATNILTGGVGWILPKACERIFLPDQVTIIVNLAFLLGLISLLPRAFVNRFLPELNRAVSVNSIDLLSALNTKLGRLLWVTYPFVIAVSLLYLVLFVRVDTLHFGELLGITSMACIHAIESQKNIINSTALTFLNKNHYTLLHNSVYLALISGALGLVYVFKQYGLFDPFLVYAFYISMLFSIKFRNYRMSVNTMQFFN